MCTTRVCEMLLSLLSTLIDIGLLTKKTMVMDDEEGVLSIHNTFMDIVVRWENLFPGVKIEFRTVLTNAIDVGAMNNMSGV